MSYLVKPATRSTVFSPVTSPIVNKRLSSVDLLLKQAIARFDESSIVGAETVTAWFNKIGNSAFDLDTVVGTAGNLTRMADGVARLVGAAGDYFSTPDSVLNSVTGDIDIRWFGSLDDITGAANQTLMSKYESTGSQRSWQMFINTTGLVRLLISENGVLDQQANGIALPFVAGEFFGLRATWSNANQEVVFYTTATIGGTWIQLGTPIARTATGIFDSSTPIEIGGVRGGTIPVLGGYCHSAQVLDGIDGTLAVNFDPTQAVAPQTAWTDTDTSAVWTPQGDAFVNTTGQDVVNSAGLVSIENSIGQTINTPMTLFAVVKETSLSASTRIFNDAKTSFALGPRFTIVSDVVEFNAGVSLVGGAQDTLPHIWNVLHNGDATTRLEISAIGSVTGNAGAEDYEFGTLFARADNAFNFTGWIGEFIVFDRALTDSEIATIQNYLEAKWT